MPIRLPRTPAHRLGRQIVDAFPVEQDFAAAIRPGGSSSPITADPVMDLPARRIRRRRRGLPLVDGEGDVNRRRPACHADWGIRPAGSGLRGPVLVAPRFPPSAQLGIQGVAQARSPRRLTASTSTTSSTPGKIDIHHSPEKRKLLPIRIRVPSDGLVGGTPTPRKDSVASVRNRHGERQPSR